MEALTQRQVHQEPWVLLGRGWESGPLHDTAPERLGSPSGTQRPPPGVNELVMNLRIAAVEHHTASKDPTQRPAPPLSSLRCQEAGVVRCPWS